MRIGFIGGTAFVGRHMVGAALERGHDVTLFTADGPGRACSPTSSTSAATARTTWPSSEAGSSMR